MCGINNKLTSATVVINTVRSNSDFCYIKEIISELKFPVGKHLNVVSLFISFTENTVGSNEFINFNKLKCIENVNCKKSIL